MKNIVKVEFGIKSCAECENNIRCEECVYNKQTIESIRMNIAKDILQNFAQFRAASTRLSAVWYELAKNYGIEEYKE